MRKKIGKNVKIKDWKEQRVVGADFSWYNDFYNTENQKSFDAA